MGPHRPTLRWPAAVYGRYGLPLASVTPLQTFVSCFVGAQDKQGGLHSDESTFKEFHYSCVLYLSTQHLDFEVTLPEPEA